MIRSDFAVILPLILQYYRCGLQMLMFYRYSLKAGFQELHIEVPFLLRQ